MKKMTSLVLTLLMIMVLAACGKATSNNQSLSDSENLPKIDGFTYYGQVPQSPKRVASLSASYTGYLMQLGLNIVAATTYDLDNPVLKKELSQAKEVMPTDLEALAATKPDVIIAGTTEANLEQLATIAPVIAVDYGKHDYLQVLSDFGQVFNKEKEAQAWLDSWKTKVTQTKDKLTKAIGQDKTFTLIGLSEKEIYLFGNNWGRGGEILYQALGFKAPEKIIQEVFPKGYLSISKEVLSAYMGDYAIVAADSTTTNSALYESDLWQAIPAVQNGNIIKVPANAFYFNDPKALDYQLEVLEKAILATNN
ncbi:iron-hydroxamate ABC transporter substrate-binding protein [Streptococcus sp. sy018]|uniref:iron-hydroxamate ABC transporter substrate-binding protein n=1 Tax=Streptococcus sp. sy018 TaxID=2600147 RepID=UPI0011B84EA0|nr:iron-hydroxamate ABC transporter substrate-binding protein [Streptococcus sp. sy018]TWS94076.1 iron-hydroxamate ABC transporter substrate-binding protein [Streptococcus sp. sy018]